MASRSRCRREIFSDSPHSGRGMRSGSVIIGDLPDGHLLCGRRAADLAYRHLAEGAHQVVLPFGWQRLPDRTGQPNVHRVIQASAPRRTVLEYRVSAARRFVSNYQRYPLWDIELFFKWIKQHLRIKRFYGTSENAVKTQIWIAVSVYVLAAIVRKRLKLEVSLYTFMQVLSVSVFEKMPMQAAFSPDAYNCDTDIENMQLNLFNF